MAVMIGTLITGSMTIGSSRHDATWIKFSANDTWHEYDIKGDMNYETLVELGLLPEGSDEIDSQEWITQPYAVEIGNDVTSIGSSVFYNCINLISVIIPSSVTSIGAAAFYGCGDSLFDMTTIPNIKLVDGWIVGTTGSLSGNLDLVGIRGIANGAFSGCTSITSVTISGSVTIGNHAFDSCTNLTSVIISSSVTRIGDGAFYDCYNLTSVTIGDGVTSIGSYAFSDCSSLTSVTFLGKTLAQVQEMDNYSDWGIDPSIINVA